MTVILVITIIVKKRTREVRFLMYKALNLVSALDKDEDVDGMEYDAFFCYRLVSRWLIVGTTIAPHMSKY